jgi:hypothetical protein
LTFWTQSEFLHGFSPVWKNGLILFENISRKSNGLTQINPMTAILYATIPKVKRDCRFFGEIPKKYRFELKLAEIFH